jgi:small subunit ribosomal protein S6
VLLSALVTYTLEALPRTSCSPIVGGPSRPEEVGLREYDVMLILPADADESVVGTAVDRIAKAIEPSGGAVANIDRWGRRRFAYELNKQTEGYYVVIQIGAEPEAIAGMERSLTLADEVIRAKVTLRPEKKKKKDNKAARAEAASPAPATA